MAKPEMVPCSGCGTMVDFHDDAWDLALTFSKALLARGEPSLKNHELALCLPCRDRDAESWAKETMETSDKANAILARVRGGYTPSGEERDWLYANGYGVRYARAKEARDK